MLEWKIKEGMTDGEKGIKKRWDWREKELRKEGIINERNEIRRKEYLPRHKNWNIFNIREYTYCPTRHLPRTKNIQPCNQLS